MTPAIAPKARRRLKRPILAQSASRRSLANGCRRVALLSSSSAMCISPIGIINAGDPRRAVLEAHEVTSLIHRDSPQDGDLAIAAATAAAFDPDADPVSVIEAATGHLDAESDMPAAIETAVDLALRTPASRRPWPWPCCSLPTAIRTSWR